ncbi:MAG: reprolysin-like metallopeptidase [Pyrinomonadaceae bacterium]
MSQKLSIIFLSVLVVCVGSVLAKNGKVNTDKKQANNDSVWQLIDESQLNRDSRERLIVPQFYKTLRLGKQALQTVLERTPAEFSFAAKDSETVLTLPLPDGKLGRFRIVESSVMAPELAAKYPEIKSYLGQGIDDLTATARFDLSSQGFRGMILSSNGTILIEPFAKNNTDNYISFYKRDVARDETFECSTGGDVSLFNADYSQLELPQAPSVVNGTQLRTYRLALAATAEYTNVFRQAGDTDAQAKTRALAAMNTIMNRVNGVYERDLSIRMVLVANTDLLIYTDSATDPYTNNNGGTMLGQNQTNIDTVIGTANYDIGHVFSTGGGGIAQLFVPCGSSKAKGVTGLPNPIGDAFAIDYVAHEMGHQFGANHTFNGAVSNCSGGNRSSGSAYEPGSGITIMAYAGICGNQNLSNHSIDTFHVKSLEAIVNFVTNSGTCSVNTATNNTPPTVSSVGGTTFNIPRNTPFVLTATGSDSNGDTLNYDWQQYDLGASTIAVPNTDADGIARPLFRPILPTTNGIRYFPSLSYILNNANVPPATTGNFLTGEALPNISRTMNFQVIARDNHAGGGGVNTATVQVVVNGSSAPFQIIQPNSNVGWRPGTTRIVSWDVGATAVAPINAANVKISLSTDGGQTFPTVISNSTPNDGFETVTVPNVTTATARIKVEAVGNIFFDVSNSNFAISPTAVTTTPFDFDGDGRADISVFRPSIGTWFLSRSTQGFQSVSFGSANDKPVAGDFDGDGRADVAVWRPTDGTWYRLNSSTGAFVATQFGANGDVPVIGDFDGDGKTDVSVFRPADGNWYRLNSGNGQFVSVQFGASGDIPAAADFDGDAKTDISVFRPSTGSWYRLNSGSNGSFSSVQFGANGDIPAAADFDGDGRGDISVFRPSTGSWYRLNSSNGSFYAVQFGTNGDIPAPADFDGDGLADVAVYRGNTWYLLQSAAGFSGVQFGTIGDKPISSSVVQ